MTHLTFILLAVLFSQCAIADNNKVSIELIGNQRCFKTNSLPDHQFGPFRNGTKVKAIQLTLCVTRKPKKRSKSVKLTGSMGIALNGIQFQPNTSGFFDPSTARGHGRNGDRNWSFDLSGAPDQRGLDNNNAHVGKLGSYHYHSLPLNLIAKQSAKRNSLVGYAADGFEIHFVGNQVTSAYQIKQGLRPTKTPSGSYDGTYNEDYEFVASSSSLDKCNMGNLDGKNVYFLTKRYPFIPRCLWGAPSADFLRERGSRNRGGNRQ
ncbi:MAG: hypothetical protein OFPI_09480 [Osedax symbiont Rs2]|nr:MAG: hypothetical protein OFPI_09480 [Osedax symbiont Rs2]